MSKLFDARVLLAMSSVVLLVACGGGGGGGDASADVTPPAPAEAPATDKYVGTWTVCTATATDTSTLYTVKVEKTAAVASYTYAQRQDLFETNATCSGAADGYFEERGTAVPDPSGSATTVEGIAGDRVILTVSSSSGQNVSITNPNFGTYKQVVATTGGTSLHVGDRSSPKDSSGYPTKLLATVYSKQ